MSRTRVFFCRQYEKTFRQLRNGRFSHSATIRESWVKRRIRTEIYEKLPFRGHFPPKHETLRGQTGTSLRAGYRSRDTLQRDTVLFHVVVQGPGSFRYLVNFSVRRTVAELRGIKVASFSDFGLFSSYKTRKTYLPVTSLQPRGYIAE